MGRNEIEDGFGCSGLVPSRRELDEQQYVDRLVRHQEKVERELREARAEVERRLCSSCLERHPLGTMCPPHEMRTTGQQWFRDRIAEKDSENERLRTALEKYADRSLWEYVSVDECTIWYGRGEGWELAARALNPEREVPNE